MGHNTIIMRDRASSNIIWQKENLPEMGWYHAFLTETFCGLMYMVSSELEESWWIETGCFKLILFDNRTGKEVYHDTCWNFYRDAFLVSDPGNAYQPRVVASGNYLFACSLHGGQKDAGGKNQYNTFLCVKFDPESKTCNVRHSSGSLENAIQAAMDSYPPVYAGFYEDELKLFGFAKEGKIIGQVVFEYKREPYRGNRCSKTIFSVDLDKILEMHNPSSIFAAVAFPLRKTILGIEDSSRYWVNYYPLYERDGNDQVVFTGIMEVFEEEYRLKGKTHALRRFEAKDLT